MASAPMATQASPVSLHELWVAPPPGVAAPDASAPPKRVRKPLTDEQKVRKAQRRKERDALKKMQTGQQTGDRAAAAPQLPAVVRARPDALNQAQRAPPPENKPAPPTVAQRSAALAVVSAPSQPVPQAPPTPALSSPAFSAVPSFITEDPLSSDQDSSSDDDCYGRPKPSRPIKYDSHGLPRPRPSYYYDGDYDAASTESKKRGRRGGMKGIPVFEPTMEEFEGQGGFYGYVKRIEKYGMRSGVVKVIPPKAWSDALPSTADPLREIRLREPIEQHMMGSQGLYRVTNVAKTRIWNAAQWKEMATAPRWAAPNFKEEREKADRTDRTPVINKRSRKAADDDGGEDGDDETDDGAQKKAARSRGPVRLGRGGMRNQGTSRGSGATEKEYGPLQQATPPETTLEEPAEAKYRKNEESTPARATRSRAAAASQPPSITKDLKASSSRKGSGIDTGKAGRKSADVKSAAATPSRSDKAKRAQEKEGEASDKDGQPAKKRLTNLQRAEPTDEEWAAFVQHFEELPHGMKKEDYTVEMMRDIERRYWRTLTFGEPPMYGADMAGSLFKDETNAWNVAKLGDLLPKLAPQGCTIPGVVSPYLYFGMWRATFAWHVEDADLYSINYIHFGAPKFWYAVPQEQAERFERVMEGYFPTDRTKCSQFLRHKAFLASPRLLANSGITLNRVAQMPGEFILTYPKGYHSGFNLGFNCAESINFATERWLPLGKVAKSCTCVGDSVTINVDTWLTEAAKAEALAKGEAWPPPRLLVPPTPPPQEPVRLPALLPRSPPLVPFKAQGKKRPAGDTAGATIPKRKKSAKALELEDMMQTDSLAPFVPPKKSKQVNGAGASVSDKPVTFVRREDFVCALCPSMSAEGLVEIDASSTPKAKKSLRAHRVCVMFTPATWIETDSITGKDVVRGYESIEKARWRLKCQLCPEIHGTKVQCTKGKCAKAVHVTCGLQEDSGFFLDVTLGSADGTEGVSLLTPAKTDVQGLPQSKEALATLDSTGTAASPLPAVEAESEAIHLTVLCKSHNPYWKQQESERRFGEMKKRVEALKPSERIRVRLPGGTFDVAFVNNRPDSEAITARYDDGGLFEVKWKNIVFGDVRPALSRQQSQTSSGKQSDMYVYHGPKVQPSKKRSGASAPTLPAYNYPMPPPPPMLYYPAPPAPPLVPIPPVHAHHVSPALSPGHAVPRGSPAIAPRQAPAPAGYGHWPAPPPPHFQGGYYPPPPGPPMLYPPNAAPPPSAWTHSPTAPPNRSPVPPPPMPMHPAMPYGHHASPHLGSPHLGYAPVPQHPYHGQPHFSPPPPPAPGHYGSAGPFRSPNSNRSPSFSNILHHSPPPPQPAPSVIPAGTRIGDALHMALGHRS